MILGPNITNLLENIHIINLSTFMESQMVFNELTDELIILRQYLSKLSDVQFESSFYVTNLS